MNLIIQNCCSTGKLGITETLTLPESLNGSAFRVFQEAKKVEPSRKARETANESYGYNKAAIYIELVGTDK